MTLPMHYISIPNIEQENFINAIFKNVVSMFEGGFKNIANKLLIELIHTLKSQNLEISKIREDIYEFNAIATSYDTEEFYDAMESVEDSIYKLLRESRELKDKSEILLELHDVIDELYTNILQFNFQVSSTAGEVRHKEEKAKIAS